VAIGLVIAYAREVLKKRETIGLVVVLVGLIYAGSSFKEWDEFLYRLGDFILQAGLFIVAVVYFLRNNLWAYVFFGFLSSSFESVVSLCGQSAAVFQRHGIILGLGAGGILLLFIWQSEKSRGHS